MGLGVLFLDLGLRTGWAYGGGEKPPVAGSIDFHHHSPEGARYAAFYDWLDWHLGGLDPAVLAFESPLMFLPGKNARLIAGGLSGIVQEVAWRRDVRCLEQDSSSIRLHFCGKGNAKKPEVMKACDDRKWKYADNNSADALAGFDFTLSRLFPDDWRRTQVGRDLLAELPRERRLSEELQ